jgi:Putative peptidoglycan binding domain
LPEAMAAGKRDFVSTAPESKLKYFWQRLRAAMLHASRFPARRGRRLAPVLAAGFFIAISIIIVFNALVGQKNRRSAPLLFSRTAPAAPANGAKNAEAFAPPAPKRPQPAVLPDEIRKKALQDSQPAHAALTGAPHDPISEILQATPPLSGASAEPTASAPKPPLSGKAMLNAQRALVKLGFVLKADGIGGRATRNAIARYQRDHGLPIDGKLTPALLRRLDTDAGLSPN